MVGRKIAGQSPSAQLAEEIQILAAGVVGPREIEARRRARISHVVGGVVEHVDFQQDRRVLGRDAPLDVFCRRADHRGPAAHIALIGCHDQRIRHPIRHHSNGLRWRRHWRGRRCGCRCRVAGATCKNERREGCAEVAADHATNTSGSAGGALCLRGHYAGNSVRSH